MQTSMRKSSLRKTVLISKGVKKGLKQGGDFKYNAFLHCSYFTLMCNSTTIGNCHIKLVQKEPSQYDPAN